MQCVRFVAWLLLCVSVVPLSAQDGARGGECYAHCDDTGSTKYSPLNQIAADNFGGLVAFAAPE